MKRPGQEADGCTQESSACGKCVRRVSGAYWDFIGDLELGSKSNGELQARARMISMEFTQPYREELTVFRISVASLVTATCM